MNKKGLEMFSVMISVFTLIVLVTAGYFLIFEPKFSGEERIIGKKAFAVFDLDKKANIQKFMIEEGLEYASYSALVNFGEKGGGCEDWDICKPDINKFKNYLEEEFLRILDNLDVGITERENYVVDLDIKDNFFIVSAYNKDKLLFIKEGVQYWFEHKQFSKKINYDLNIYDKLYEMYDHSIEKCSLKKEFIEDLNVNIKCDDSGKEMYIKFEVSQDLLFVDPVIKFKVAKLGKLL